MKRNLLSVLLACCFGMLQAQDIRYDIQKSEVFEMDIRYSALTSVAEDDEGGLTMAYKTDNGYLFQQYSSSMHLIRQHEQKMKDQKVINVMVNNDKAIIVGLAYNKKARAYVCTATTASVSDFKFTAQELFKIPAEDPFEINFRMGNVIYEGMSFITVLPNKDKSAFAVYVDIDAATDEGDMRKLTIYDTNLATKFENEYPNDDKSLAFSYQDIEVAPHGGAAYCLGKVYQRVSRNSNSTDKFKYYYEMLMLDKEGYKKQLFDTERYLAKNLSIVLKESSLTCIGFYSNYGGLRAEGIAYYDMDPVTLDINTQNLHPFTTQLFIDKFGKEMKQGLNNLEVNSVFLTPDNTIILNAEEIESGSVQNKNLQHFSDIVTAAIDSDGNLLWSRGIKKEQLLEGGSRYLSYTSAITGGNAYFFLNTGEKPKDLGRGRIVFGKKNAEVSNLNLVKVNKQGDIEFKEILATKDNSIPFMTATGLVSKKGDMVYFLGERDDKKQLIKVSILN